MRAMNALVEHKDAVDGVKTGLLRPFIRTTGVSEQDDDVRKFGMSKDGVVVRQVMLVVVQTAEGLPLYHEVFEGNTAEVTTLKAVIQKIVQRRIKALPQRWGEHQLVRQQSSGAG